MCPTLPEIAACTARKIRLLRRQCALHGCKGFLPRTGVMSGTSAKCTFHIRQRWGSPNGEMKDTNLEVWRWTLRATPRLPLRRKSRKATSMCPTLPEIAACTARKIRLLRRQCALHGCKGFSTSNGGYVRYLCQVHLSHHLLRVISGSARAAPMAKWRTPTWKFGDGHFGPLQHLCVQPSQKLPLAQQERFAF